MEEQRGDEDVLPGGAELEIRLLLIVDEKEADVWCCCLSDCTVH